MKPPSNFAELVYTFTGLIKLILPIIWGLALLAFFWGLAKFIFAVSGDEKAVADGKNIMLWGIIALFILFTFQAIIAFFYGDLGFAGRPAIPYLPDGL